MNNITITETSVYDRRRRWLRMAAITAVAIALVLLLPVTAHAEEPEYHWITDFGGSLRKFICSMILGWATSIFNVYNQLINHVGTEALLSGPFDSLLGTDMYNLTNNIFQTAVIPIGESILALFMLFGLSERSRLRRENAVLDQLRVSEERQYELDKRAVEMVNIKCHDLKHQIAALRGMQGEEQERALKDIEEAVMIYDSIAQTGCKPLDLILKNKYLLCEKEGIRFTYMADGEKLAFLSSVDIYSLFGNALDNAIRACGEIEDRTHRLINMSVTAHANFLRIHIENSIAKAPVFCNGLPVTTQQDTAYHGYGMLSMRRIAESYGGVMEVSCKDCLFSLDMTIPMRPAVEKSA